MPVPAWDAQKLLSKELVFSTFENFNGFRNRKRFASYIDIFSAQDRKKGFMVFCLKPAQAVIFFGVDEIKTTLF